jgi:hypothetical protein
MAYLLSRNSRIEEDLIDQLFNSSEKRLARLLLLLRHVAAVLNTNHQARLARVELARLVCKAEHRFDCTFPIIVSCCRSRFQVVYQTPQGPGRIRKALAVGHGCIYGSEKVAELRNCLRRRKAALHARYRERPSPVD